MEVGSSTSANVVIQNESAQRAPAPRQESSAPQEQAELATSSERPAPDPNARVGGQIDTFA